MFLTVHLNHGTGSSNNIFCLVNTGSGTKARTQIRSYPSAQTNGRTTRTEENTQPSENRISHEGRSAPERAQAARSLVRLQHLRTHPRSPQRQAALCLA